MSTFPELRLSDPARWQEVVVKKRAQQSKAIEAFAGCSDDDDNNITEIGSAAALAAKITASEVSSQDVVKRCIARAIEAHKKTNCFTEIMFEDALKEARRLDDHLRVHGKPVGPLHGVPITLKDQFDVAGYDTTLGYTGRAFKPTSEDAVLWGETDNPLWGLTTHPLNPKYTPGGSTGGEATLLALQGSMLGWGTDIGGSIRIPAHMMGLYGLKPSSSRLPYTGAAVSTEGQEHVPSSIGPLARSLSTIHHVLKELVRQEPWMKDCRCAPVPWREDVYNDVLGRKLTVGLILDDGVVRPHPPITRVVQAAANALIANGHEVVQWPSDLHAECIEVMDRYYTVDGGEDIRRDVMAGGEPFIPHVEKLVNRGKPISVYEYWQLNRRKKALQQAYLNKWNNAKSPTTGKPVDVILMPVMPHTAVPHCASRWVGYTKVWNVLDYTALVLPGGKVTQGDCNDAWEHAPRNEMDEWNAKIWADNKEEMARVRWVASSSCFHSEHKYRYQRSNGRFRLIAEKMENLEYCDLCRDLSSALGRWEASIAQGSPQTYRGQTDYFLGLSADLEVRKSKGCVSCGSILASQDKKELQKMYGEIYAVSAHLRVKQPLLYITWGNLKEGNEDAAYRRSQIWNFRCSMLLSTNPILTGNPMGRGRPYDLDHYNAGLIKRWIERCDKHHESTCTGTYQDFLLPEAKLSFIDVENRCIVTPDEPVRYAALSYVWGLDKVPLATKANIASLRIPGAFLPGGLELPRTINDTVRLCSWLGIRYLWVDSMCIVQDDVETKMEQIQAMGSVYSKAYLTIAALSSGSAISGIARVGRPSTTLDSWPFVRLPFQTLVGASQGAIGLAPINHAPTSWKQRAWTLQEMVFSKRLLGLGPVASWACSGAHWTEDLELPSEMEGQPAFTKNLEKTSIAVWPDMGEYARLAQIYAGRNLTMSSDTLNAFEGIMTPLSQWFPGYFLFGTPEFTFDIGLLWQYRRRGAIPRSGVDWSCGEHEFPSWSWISYQGSHLDTFWETDFTYPQPALVVYPLVQWKKREKSTGSWKDVDNSYHRVRTHFEKPDAALPDGWTKHDNGSDPPYYQHPSHSHVQPHPKFRYPIPPFQRLRDIYRESYDPDLLFEGGIAVVKFRYKGTAKEYDEKNRKLQTEALVPEMDIVDAGTGAWIGWIRLNLQPGSTLPEPQEEQEVIAISEATVRVSAGKQVIYTWSELADHKEVISDDLYRFVNVLWIGWTENGKVYRKALGRVWRAAWEKLSVDKISVILT
ncbi:hypothetical protein S40285_02481 [Stachybotrys chlorohalonatus IBT 40285]|uniref:Heterokaryon incompatibility domain-containing protein n=1 Tax=Stachybotrys chlorohalonatus (strain IBT 40285) TaxID=1283841 RepID=A0A084QWM1_STAC4|nr:hypothetical protein S40285_02481 [Stachybotrys chlorohalonata IBT 40285]